MTLSLIEVKPSIIILRQIDTKLVSKSSFQIVFAGVPAEYIRSKKGNALLRDPLGYYYRLDKNRKNGTKYWRCLKMDPRYGKCKASVQTLDDRIICRRNEHNHLAKDTD